MNEKRKKEVKEIKKELIRIYDNLGQELNEISNRMEGLI